jgi:alpha-tubulin suppressor-like RCC1 family protein
VCVARPRTATGQLYVWGAHKGGRLGLLDAAPRVLLPTLVDGAPWDHRAVTHVACGGDFTVGACGAEGKRLCDV